jgi:hypothetical protein
LGAGQLSALYGQTTTVRRAPMEPVRSCPEVSGLSKLLIRVVFRLVGAVQLFVRVVRYPDKGACPEGAFGQCILSSTESIIEI